MLAARLIWLITLVSPLIFLTSSAELINCEHPQTFSVETETDKLVYVRDAEIAVNYDRNELAVYEYYGTDVVNILLNNTLVFFAEHVDDSTEFFHADVFRRRVLNTKIGGSAKLLDSGNNEKLLTDCTIYLAKDTRKDTGLPHKLEIEILRRAASCIRPSICSRLGNVTPEDFQNAETNPFAFGPLSAIPKRVRDFVVARLPESNSVEKGTLQSTINILVDIVIAEIVKKLRERNEGTIKIPDISLDITEKSIWKPQGKLEATRGNFSDLTTLTRTKDATLSHDGLRFTASCGFGLSKANINYQKYKLRYGLSMSGSLSATIDGLRLATTVIVDFRHKPCRVILKELRVEELGKIKIKMTGLGPFNGLLSKFATWVTTKWKEEIVVEVERKIKEVVQDHLSMFDCENFRP